MKDELKKEKDELLIENEEEDMIDEKIFDENKGKKDNCDVKFFDLLRISTTNFFEKQVNHSYNEKSFKARYGVPIQVVERVFLEIDNVKISDLMLTLNYLKHYPPWEYAHQNSFVSDHTFPIKIQRPEDYRFQERIYSGKYGYHCLKFELAVRPRDGRICWLSGPAAGSTVDCVILKNSGLLNHLS